MNEPTSADMSRQPTATRRDRRVAEIAALVVAGRHQRAADLALIHADEFPDDAEQVLKLADPRR
jgi:hypothetical protein